MRLVVDSNRIFASLIKDSFSRKVLFSKNFVFYTIPVVHSDLSKYWGELLEKSGLEKKDFDSMLDLLFSRVSFVEDSSVQKFMPEAKKAMDSVDAGDTPFVAASLAIKADGVWSDDRHFERQNLVKVFKTKDLTQLL